MNTNNEKQVAEKISAYLDDALSADEIDALLAAHATSGDAAAGFSVATRYHMVGEALRGELSDAAMLDVSARIHEAVQHASFDAAAPVKTAAKSSAANRFDLWAWLEAFARPLTGMAVAVSVAVLMVVTVVQLESPVGGQQLVNAPAVLPAAAPVTLVANKPPVAEPAVAESQPADFNNYLTEHAEFAAQDTLQGRIPYVRAVSYEAE